jgi:hypothetical protein
MTVDGLLELRRDLRLAQARIRPEGAKVVERGALNIKNGLAESARRIRHAPTHLPYFPRSISYDLNGLTAEIGPDKDRGGTQAALGNILAFGSRNNPALWDITKPLLDEEPRFVEQVADLAVRLLEP